MQTKAQIFDIQDFSVQDGPGIRTTVFMKGCPLKCIWCSNPEGQNSHPELMHINGLCDRTYNCISSCPNDAVHNNSEKGFPEFNRAKCNTCETRECIDVCPSRALKFVGKHITVGELIKRISQNTSFYKNSGGGVTFSGGEPFLQIEFLRKFIIFSSSLGLSIGVETCGLFDWSEVKGISDKFDFIFFDLKCMDSKIHKKVTGSSNEKILANLKSLVEINPKKIIISIPVVPGVNDSEVHIKPIADFCREKGIQKIRLLPYHSLGESKYDYLGREYFMDKDLSVPENHLDDIKKLIESNGIFCYIED